MNANLYFKVFLVGALALCLAAPCIVCGLVAEDEPILPQVQANSTASLAPLVIGTTSSISQDQPVEEAMAGDYLFCTAGQEECLVSHENAREGAAPAPFSTPITMSEDVPENPEENIGTDVAVPETENPVQSEIISQMEWGQSTDSSQPATPAAIAQAAPAPNNSITPPFILADEPVPGQIKPATQPDKVADDQATDDQAIEPSAESIVPPVGGSEPYIPAGYVNLLNTRPAASAATGGEFWVMIMAVFGMVSYLFSSLAIFAVVSRQPRRHGRRK